MREVYLFHSLLCYIGWINFGLALWINFELAKTKAHPVTWTKPPTPHPTCPEKTTFYDLDPSGPSTCSDWRQTHQKEGRIGLRFIKSSIHRYF